MRLSSKTLTGVLHAQNKGACDWGYQDKLAFGCQNIVVIVDPKTVQVIQTLDKHKGYVVKVKWAHENYHHDLLSSYNLRLASADFNGRIIVWDVAQASIKAEFSEGSKPIADMEWIKNNDASHDLLAILHPPYSLVLWNADTGTKIWKKSYTEPVQSFSFDPFDVHKIAFLGNDCIVFVDDFTINKVPSSNGKKFYISSPSAQGGSNGNSGNEKSQERRSSKLLGRKVSSILIGESNKKSGEEENVALNECLQLTYHKACRGHLILLYPREILILDLDINQTVGIVPMERAGSPFVQVMTMMQRDALMCLHENGGISLRVRRRSSVSTPSPEQVSTFGTQEDSPINTSSLDVAYDLRCQSDALRITKHNKLYGVMVCPMSEMQVALIMSDSRVLIWQLKSAEYPGHNTDLSSPVYSPGSSPHSDFGFSLSGSGRSGVLPPKTALSSLIGHSAGRMDGSVVSGNRKQFLHKHGLPLKFILIGLLNGVAPPPFVLRMCPPLTTKNWNVYQPLLALGTHTGTIQVYNLSSAAIWREYNIHTCTVRGIEWVSLHSFMSFAYPNPGPSNLVKNEIIITDTLTGKTTHLRANREEESPIETIKISYLKQYFVLVFKDKPFELWDLRSGTLLRQMPKNFPHVTAMEWSPSHSMKSLKKKLTQEAVSPPASSGGMIVSQAESITSSVTSLDPVGSLLKNYAAPHVEGGSSPPAGVAVRPDTKQLLGSVAAREHFVFTDSDGLLYHFSVEGNVIKEGSKIPPDGGMGSITSIAWKGETMVLGDVDGNLNLWDLKARVSRAVPTHRGWIKKLKFAPGRGNMKLLVLYNDGVDIWDAKEVELVSSIKSPRDITKVTDADWAASDKPVLACADGCVRVMDLKMKLGSAAMEEYQLVEPIFCPHIMEPKASLTLKYVLQHQPWRKSYNLKLDDLGENMAEELVNSVNEQLQILDGEMKEYLPNCQFGTAERCLLTARLFGDESELTFWTVALHYMRTEKVQPMSKSCSRLAMSQTGSSGDLFIPSSTPGSKESTDLVDFGEPSKEKTPHLAHFRDSPLETCFDILCDSQSFQKCQLDRIALHDNKRVTYEHTRRCAENLMLLGQADRAVQLLLETEADNEQYYVDNLRACLVASIRSSGASQSTIKLVATNLIASGKLSEGVQLLCLIDKGLDASRYLQTYGQWYQAAWLAKATLSYPECAEVMKRWADHMSSSLVNQKNRAVLVMLSLGQFMKVVELLYAMRQFDRATLFIEACNEFGLLDKSEETNPLIEAVFLEYARHMISLGNRDATEHYCHLAGEKGKQLQKEIENIFSAVKEKISNTES